MTWRVKRYNIITLILGLASSGFELVSSVVEETDSNMKKVKLDDWLFRCSQYEKFVDPNGYFAKCLVLKHDSNDFSRLIAKEVTRSPQVLKKEFHKVKNKKSQVKYQYEQDRKHMCQRFVDQKEQGEDPTTSVKEFWKLRREFTIHVDRRKLWAVCKKVKKSIDNLKTIENIHFAMFVNRVVNDSDTYHTYDNTSITNYTRAIACKVMDGLENLCTGLWYFQSLQLCTIYSMQATINRDCKKKEMPYSKDEFIQKVGEHPPFEGTPYSAHEHSQPVKSSWNADYDVSVRASSGARRDTFHHKSTLFLFHLFYIFMSMQIWSFQ